MKEKWIRGTQAVFAYGMSILLVIGFFAALVYAAALILGQPASVRVHTVMSTWVLGVWGWDPAVL